MSLSKPRGAKSPVKKYYEWKSAKKCFQYWSKELNENVEVSLPLSFIVLDEKSTIKGYNDETNSGIFSNEVSNISRETLLVRTFKGNKSIKGKYKDIKAKIKDLGGRFAKAVYAYIPETDEMVCIIFVGASMSAWIDHTINVSQDIISVSSYKDAKKGATKYTIPVFTRDDSVSTVDKGDYFDKAIVKDLELQEYFEAKLKDVGEVNEMVAEADKEVKAEEALDSIPFRSKDTGKVSKTATKTNSKKTSKKSNEVVGTCPHKHKFGADVDSFDDCADCAVYEECITAS